MIKNILLFTFSAAFFSLIFVSCNKEKTHKSETNLAENKTGSDIYTLETDASKIEWRGYKIFKSENLAHFGTVPFKNGEISAENGKLISGKLTVDVNSIVSEDLQNDPAQMQKLIGHLKSKDFFETEKYPDATFEITKTAQMAEGDYNTLLSGNLTIKDKTNPVQFRANISLKGDEISIRTEPFDINRKEFNLNFNSPAENGVIKDEMTLQVNIKAKK
ncbi:polyisoprenoid-binding protein [Chryseobacterium sp. Leaf180]|jgi:polyisoprenoid-binding protein YceI|uniref:YceI family protein n=1 Tax=Chryseobacterium sp. Leaf180 TaxID=1736289 RepID=UPI0006F5C5C4|nr:YceI family protein [Chryseobacterium sp. Leaf180]KQR92635.1 polyisoprenoid-binding protein [Chryseobacterium sp. Leaf180]